MLLQYGRRYLVMPLLGTVNRDALSVPTVQIEHLRHDMQLSRVPISVLVLVAVDSVS